MTFLKWSPHSRAVTARSLAYPDGVQKLDRHNTANTITFVLRQQTLLSPNCARQVQARQVTINSPLSKAQTFRVQGEHSLDNRSADIWDKVQRSILPPRSAGLCCWCPCRSRVYAVCGWRHNVPTAFLFLFYAWVHPVHNNVSCGKAMMTYRILCLFPISVSSYCRASLQSRVLKCTFSKHLNFHETPVQWLLYSFNYFNPFSKVYMIYFTLSY